MSVGNGAVLWRPLAVLQKTPNVSKNLAVMILNRPLEPLVEELEILWHKALYKVAVDGGASRLWDIKGGPYIPDLVTGDFDSCSQETLQNLKEKGVEVVHTEDQDFTDFTKCLKIIADRVNKTEERPSVFIQCKSPDDDRTEYCDPPCVSTPKWTVIIAKHCIYDSARVKGQMGSHRIEVNTGLEGEWCGLVPIGCQSNDVTTTGLKWNLTHNSLEFGELISTSNTYDGSGTVTVSTSQPLLWTMGYQISRSNQS